MSKEPTPHLCYPLVRVCWCPSFAHASPLFCSPPCSVHRPSLLFASLFMCSPSLLFASSFCAHTLPPACPLVQVCLLFLLLTFWFVCTWLHSHWLPCSCLCPPLPCPWFTFAYSWHHVTLKCMSHKALKPKLSPRMLPVYLYVEILGVQEVWGARTWFWAMYNNSYIQ